MPNNPKNYDVEIDPNPPLTPTRGFTLIIWHLNMAISIGNEIFADATQTQKAIINVVS